MDGLLTVATVPQQTEKRYILLWIPTILNVFVKPEASTTNVPQVASAKITDELQVSSVKTVEDSKTEINESFGQGIVSAYWEVLLSNVGDRNLSVIDYKLRQVGKDFPVTSYTYMDQGLYSFLNGEPIKESLPFDISPGGTKKIFVRIGLMMTPTASQMVKGKFQDMPASKVSLKTIWRFLYTKRTDFYDNKVIAEFFDDGDTMSVSFPPVESLREQEFVISFSTSRMLSIKEPLSWYKFGGPYDSRRRKF